MKIKSSAFKHNQSIPAKYTCDGENINPPLSFLSIPKETKTLALIVEDPDVPKSMRPDGMWDHWLVWNMPPDTKKIPESSEPPGTQGRNTSGSFSYIGPCPPDREHRYFFKLYALDTELHLDINVNRIELEEAMKNHILAQAELIGLYNRK